MLNWLNKFRYKKHRLSLSLDAFEGERRIDIFEFDVLLYQNGFNERKAEIIHSTYNFPCTPKAHPFYRLKVERWLKGVDFDGLPKKNT